MKQAARRALSWLLLALLAGGLIVVAAVAGLTARLAQGPLELPRLAGPIAERLSDPSRGLYVKIDNIILTLSDDLITGHSRLEVHALGATVARGGGAPLAAVPETAIDLSAAALLRGRLRPTRLELIRPRVVVTRRPDGGFGFDIGDDEAATAQGESTPVAADLLASLTRPVDSSAVLGLMRVVAVRDGDMTLIDEGRGLRWRASPAALTLQRAEGGDVEGRLKLTLDAGSAPAPLDGRLTYDAGAGAVNLAVDFAQLRPAALAGMAADLAALGGFDVPLQGEIKAKLNRDFRLAEASFDIIGGAGRVLPPQEDAAVVDVRRLAAAGRWDAASRWLTLDEAALAVDGATLETTATLALRPDGTPTPLGGEAKLTLDGFNPTRLATLVPALAPHLAAARLDSPLTGGVTARLRDGAALSAAVDLTLGAGSLRVDGVFAESLPLRGGRVRGEGDVAAGGLRLDELSLDFDGPALKLGAAAQTRDGRLTLDLDAGLTHVPVARLNQLWPPIAGAKAREWVLKNLTGGVAPSITAKARLSAPLDNLADVTPDKVAAEIIVEDAELHYFRPLPPAVKVTRTVADFDGKDFFIRIQGGEVHAPGVDEPVRAGEGVVRIFNVGSPREDLTVDIGLTGPLRAVLTVVDLPPLGYPSKLDIDPAKTAGQVDGRLKVSLPLFDSVKLDDVEVQVSAKATGAAIEKVVAGRDAAEGELAVDLDTKAMTVTGKARFDGAPITLTWREVFDSTVKGPGTVLEAQGRSDVRHLATFGPDFLTEYARGPVGAKVRYASGENRQATLNVELDLAQTDLRVAPINWKKPPGVAAQSRFVMHFLEGKPTRLTDLRLDGAGLQAAAAVQLADGGKEVARIDAPRVKAGGVDVAVSMIRSRDGVYAVKATGASYDVRGLLGDEASFEFPPETARGGGQAAGRKPPPSSPSAPPLAPPMTVELQVDRLLFGDDRGVVGAEGRMRRDGGEWVAIGLRGQTPPKGDLAIRLDRNTAGIGALTLDASDAGAALRALDVTDRVRGGTLRVRGSTSGAGPQAVIEGGVVMDDYTIVDAPALARILNAMSVTGLAELLSGEGISFGNLTGSFHKQGDKLRLWDMRTAGGALGLTLEGDINLAKDTARLNGTIVPIYGVNRILGQIPLLGDLLSGGPGQGLFAATWTVEGPLADPAVSVNPLALLTPGFLRNLFFGGGGGAPGERAPAIIPEMEPQR